MTTALIEFAAFQRVRTLLYRLSNILIKQHDSFFSCWFVRVLTLGESGQHRAQIGTISYRGIPYLIIHTDSTSPVQSSQPVEARFNQLGSAQRSAALRSDVKGQCGAVRCSAVQSDRTNGRCLEYIANPGIVSELHKTAAQQQQTTDIDWSIHSTVSGGGSGFGSRSLTVSCAELHLTELQLSISDPAVKTSTSTTFTRVGTVTI